MRHLRGGGGDKKKRKEKFAAIAEGNYSTAELRVAEIMERGRGRSRVRGSACPR